MAPSAAIEAARERLGRAQGAPPLERFALQLEAAELLIDEGEVSQGAAIANRIQDAPLSDDLRSYKALVMSKIELARGETELALASLPPPSDQLSDDLRSSIHSTRSVAYQRLGNRLEAAREAVLADPLITGSEQREDNRTRIRDLLGDIDPSALQPESGGSEDLLLRGWIEEAQLRRRHQTGTADLEQAMHDLARRYPGHPLFSSQPVTGGQATALTERHPERIALLLPLTGRLAAAGQAVRDGILAAYFQDKQQEAASGPAIRIYDSGGGVGTIWGLYRQALADGAGAVIGPLDKESVSILAQSGTLDIPLLALNHVEQATHGDFYQFSLAPEDEARSVAMRAWLEGHTRALLLLPEGDWGSRIALAFREQWQKLGNQVVEESRYNPQESDFSAPIEAMLDLDESRQRFDAVRQTIQRRVEFEPRRRTDIDLIVVAAQPRQGRLIRPQLRFHQAGDIATYATSHIYGGRVDPAADRDLDGLVFCDMPWSLPTGRDGLRSAMEAIWPQEIAQNGPLFALGIDAYRLLPGLIAGSGDPGNGITGSLYLGEGNRIHRELGCARFEGGIAVASQPAAATHDQTEDTERGESDQSAGPSALGNGGGGAGKGVSDQPGAATDRPEYPLQGG